tara:strand:- start:567 stop:1436 length:870 start_codon:yes stop_codon:yes gene_type:complete
MPIKHLVFSGGAYKGLYTIGALKYLNDQGFYNFDDLENIYGTSVGSIIGLIVCLKLEFNDIINYIIFKPWQNMFKFSTNDIWNIISKRGLLYKDFIYSLFETLFKNAGLSTDITLLDLYNFSNITLHLYTTNITKFILEDLSHKTNPNIKVLDAVYMSACYPFVFQPPLINNCYYLDGGIINPYPLNLCLKDYNKNDILAIHITDNGFKSIDENSNVFYFGFFLFYKLMCSNYKYKISEKIPYELLIPAKTLSLEDAKKIANDNQIRKQMIDQGINYAKLFLKNNSKKT